LGKTDSTDLYLKAIKTKSLRDLDKLRLARLFISSKKIAQADEVLEIIAKNEEPYFMADYFYTQGLLFESKTNKKGAIEFLKQAIAANPYHIKAIEKLIQWYEMNGSKIKARELKTKLNSIKNKKLGL
jgi:predicted negative regulator of RcsB-dependent stress response